MTIPQHPLNPAWLAIEAIIDSWEAAAMKVLTTFCEQHPIGGDLGSSWDVSSSQ
jgi:hypothetical protein